MAKKRKSKPRKDYGDDLIDVAKFGIKAGVVLGVANTVIGATKK